MSDYERGKLDGAAAERKRISAILSLPEAKKLPEMAATLAFRGNTSATDAASAMKFSASSAGSAAGWETIVDEVNNEKGVGR